MAPARANQSRLSKTAFWSAGGGGCTIISNVTSAHYQRLGPQCRYPRRSRLVAGM